MDYQILPTGDVWAGGMLCVPQKIVTDYIKMASDYQLKAILIILANNGKMNSQDLAKQLGLTQNDVETILDFWVSEGVLICDGAENVNTAKPISQIKSDNSVKKVEPKKTNSSISISFGSADTVPAEQRKLENLPRPTLSPKDIVEVCDKNPELTELLRNAQEVMGKTLSHAEQEMLINMVNYYGLPPAIVLMILHYYKSEKEKGNAIGTSYACAMAKNWAEEGITDLSAAEDKLRAIESSDKIWNEIIALTGIRHKCPTVKQREMISDWCDSFSMDMIALACDAMKENADKPTLNYVDKVLKNWKKKNITTPSDVENDRKNFEKSKENKQNNDKIQAKPSYDIDEIKKNAMLNTEFDI